MRLFVSQELSKCPPFSLTFLHVSQLHVSMTIIDSNEVFIAINSNEAVIQVAIKSNTVFKAINSYKVVIAINRTVQA